MPPKIKNKLKKEEMKIRNEVRKKILTYITAAFGLVAGLAWNDAIKALIDYLFPLNSDSLMVKFGYAIGVTTIIVIISIYLARLLKEEAEKN